MHGKVLADSLVFLLPDARDNFFLPQGQPGVSPVIVRWPVCWGTHIKENVPAHK